MTFRGSENHPTFKPPTHSTTHPTNQHSQSRSCILLSFEIDMVGFAPAVTISGPSSLAPLMTNLKVGCSGHDAVDVGGAARPLLLGCTLTVGGGESEPGG